jgi:hypothetical protein
MRAQVVFTPAESKCFISKAIARMDIVQKALSNGTVIIHPSTSTYFLVKEITGDIPRTTHWVLGGVFPQGLCPEANAGGDRPPSPKVQTLTPPKRKPAKFIADGFPFKWVIRGGKLSSGTSLGSLLSEIGPEDVYVKGCNAVDNEGNAGVLYGHEGGGTIGRVMGEHKRKKFHVILAVGLERLINVPMAIAAKATARHYAFDYGMGMPCGLYPIKVGDRINSVTEIQAVEILSGAKAIQVASGGIGGAEGATILAIEGDKKQVTKAIEYIEQSKGAQLPFPRPSPCQRCSTPDCQFSAREKHWYPRWIG